MANFKNITEYRRWCDAMVTKIYYANIAMKDKRIKEVVEEISRRMHVHEGEQLIG